MEKLTIQSAGHRARAVSCRDDFSYADILNRDIGHSRPGRRVRFSLSYPTPASTYSLRLHFQSTMYP